MTWRILDADGRGVESHSTVLDVTRAMLILSAHEVKNGRTANYTITPLIISGPTIDECDLPDWALEALGVKEEC